MKANARPLPNVKARPKMIMTTANRNRINAFFITMVAVAILVVFLMPFLYMIFTSLKTPVQMAAVGAPIWPATNPTVVYGGENTKAYTLQVIKTAATVNQKIDMSTYAGKTLDIYTVPLPDGSKKDLALLMGFNKSSIFIDPANPAGDPIVWTGGFYKTLPRPWIFSPTWKNYSDVWEQIKFPQTLGNTLFYTVTTTIGVLLSCTLAAYGFSRFRFPGRDFLFVVMIATIFLPGSVTIIPTYTFFTQVLHWGQTWWPLIVPAFFVNPYDTFLLRQFFMTLPRELDESAKVDGAGPLRILWSIILPQSWPVIVAVTVFHVVYAWNDYFGPLIYLSAKFDLQPISVALARFNGMFGTFPWLIQAGSLLTLIIPLIIFIVAQRFFVQGIVISGVEK